MQPVEEKPAIQNQKESTTAKLDTQETQQEGSTATGTDEKKSSSKSKKKAAAAEKKSKGGVDAKTVCLFFIQLLIYKSLQIGFFFFLILFS